MAEARANHHLVVVGSSAGGIDALSILVSTLPVDFAAPVVIAQHLDPSRPSHLGDILGRRTKLPVKAIQGEERLKAGTIYVVPSNHQVRVNDTMVEAHPAPSEGRPMPSVDQLLTSAAEAYGEQLIAVILSGTGSDGAAGAYMVKRAGGTVVIQDPDTASYPGMPLSLSPTTVDIIAPLERVGPILNDLLAGLDVPTRPETQKTLEGFLDELRERNGIDFNSYKPQTILRRLQRRIVATESENLAGYMQYLHAHPDEYQQLISAFLIKVTEFFRDPEFFSYLREKVLPEMVAYARKHGNELRIWSAGCATGEEAYSLAILVSEVLGASLEQFSIRIFATDIDGEAIAFARRGIYPASALAHLPEELVNRYFLHDDGGYHVKKRVRALTVFGHHDLGQRAPFPHTDLVVCRNVLIYFTPDLQQRTLKLFAYSLREGGYLALGKAETTGQLSEFFVPRDKAQKVYERHGERILPPPTRGSITTPLPPPRPAFNRRLPTSGIVPANPKEVQRIRPNSESLLLNLPVGVVVVDRHYDIQAINAAARGFLAIFGQAIGEDLIHLAQSAPSGLLRAAIDQAFAQGIQTGVEEFIVEDPALGEQRVCQISCHPRHEEGESGPTTTVVVVISDITALARSRRTMEQRLETTATELEHTRGEAHEEAARRERLLQQLGESNRQLLAANQELANANEEMRTTNEEFLLNNEEAQAAIEEVETLNEEMQATNEELETLNEELQATVEELNTTNDDLHARSMELQELARTSERESGRLKAILLSMGDAVLVVNRSGEPLLTNAAYERMFGSASSAITFCDEAGTPLPDLETPQRRAARGEAFRMEFTVRGEPKGAHTERRTFEVNGQPVGNGGGELGGVLVIRDITERTIHRLQQEFLALASHELRTPLTPMRAALQSLVSHLSVGEDGAKQRRLAEIALGQTQRLARLVDDLLDASRLQSGKYTLTKEPLRFDELVERTVETTRGLGNQHELRLTIESAPLVINGDAGRLEQIIWNLVTNAITYAPESEHIDLTLRQVEQNAELRVRDYGPGIAPEDLSRIFTRFFQVTHQGNGTPHRGLGLGLYIVREIVQAHDGHITVESTLGEGTTFTVRLPLA